jgi:predicted SAM-dependent methyltransferase
VGEQEIRDWLRSHEPPDLQVSKRLSLNLGCGPVQPAGWVNIDGSNRAWLAAKLPFIDKILSRFVGSTEFGPHVLVHDLYKPLPFEERSVDCIYAGELWEHFEYQDAYALTLRCWRVLKSGGVLRICVPDGVSFWRRYIEIHDALLGQPKESRCVGPLRDYVAMYFEEICTRRLWFGSMGHKHKWQFDEVQLIDLFERCGFIEVERKSFHDSRIVDIASVERSDFLIVEGVKP